MKKEYTSVQVYRKTKQLLDKAAQQQSDRKKPAVWHDLIQHAVDCQCVPSIKKNETYNNQ